MVSLPTFPLDVYPKMATFDKLGPAASVGDRAPAVLSRSGAPLSWTIERADTFFVCERE
jgi:hypothetical protein